MIVPVITALAVSALPGSLVPAHASSAARAGASLARPGALNSVVAFSASNAWAVGLRGVCAPKPVITHWDGTRWVRVPVPAGVHSGSLIDVAGASASDVWAVGWAGPLIGKRRALMLHWNGTRWRRVGLHGAKGAVTLAGVDAISASRAWAAGYTRQGHLYLARWNGRDWRSLHLPRLRGNSLLTGVAAISTRNVWAVGTILGGSGFSFVPVILHWNGRRWFRAAVPHLPGGAFLNKITAVGPGRLWISGFTDKGRALILRRVGTSWRRVATPNVIGGVNDVTQTAPDDAWAVGSRQEFVSVSCGGQGSGSETMFAKVTAVPVGAVRLPAVAGNRAGGRAGPLIFHWNGTAWKRVKAATRRFGVSLEGVSATSATNIWAVGGLNYFKPKESIVILHSNGHTWN